MVEKDQKVVIQNPNNRNRSLKRRRTQNTIIFHSLMAMKSNTDNRTRKTNSKWKCKDKWRNSQFPDVI
jgi:hypothetical protein